MASLSGVVMVQVLILSSLSPLAVSLDPYLSNKNLGRLLVLHAKPEETVQSYGLSYEDVLQSLPLYARRRIAIIGQPGELAMGQEHAEDASEWFITDPGASEAWRTPPTGAWLVTSDGVAKYWRSIGKLDSFDLVGREGTLVLFAQSAMSQRHVLFLLLILISFSVRADDDSAQKSFGDHHVSSRSRARRS